VSTLYKFLSVLVACLLPIISKAEENILNVYTWAGVIPDAVIQQFENETHIKVNFSTYDSNEVMYAKLKSTKNASYDIVQPSSYYIERMHRQNMLEKLDKTKLSHFKNLNPALLNQAYDPKNTYSIPFIWGTTGIFFNKDYHAKNKPRRWSDFWQEAYRDQLMLLDDPREVFAVAMRVLGYSINDTNPDHIKEAYLKLKTLLPNVKIFSNAVLSLLIDEDTTVGMAWNGDLFKAKKENNQLEFVFPEDGFAIWVDNLAIPKDAPHRNNAYQFLNFILRAEVARTIALETNFPIANLAAQKLLPPEIKNSPIIYPPQDILRKGEFQKDVGEKALALYEKYWEQLKMGG